MKQGWEEYTCPGIMRNTSWRCQDQILQVLSSTNTLRLCEFATIHPVNTTCISASASSQVIASLGTPQIPTNPRQPTSGSPDQSIDHLSRSSHCAPVRPVPTCIQYFPATYISHPPSSQHSKIQQAALFYFSFWKFLSCILPLLHIASYPALNPSLRQPHVAILPRRLRRPSRPQPLTRLSLWRRPRRVQRRK